MLNHLHRNGVPFYNVKKIDSSTITLRMKYIDALKLKPVRKDFKCKISFQKRGGAPHYYQKERKLPQSF